MHLYPTDTHTHIIMRKYIAAQGDRSNAIVLQLFFRYDSQWERVTLQKEKAESQSEYCFNFFSEKKKGKLFNFQQ